MFGFLDDLLDPIINWVTGDSGGAVQAIASEAIKTAVTGTFVGAATAAIQGNDILDGALKGAAYGALAGGVLETVTGMTQDGRWETPVNSASAMLEAPSEARISVGIDTEDLGKTDTKSSTTMTQTAPSNKGGILGGFFNTTEGRKTLVDAGLGAIKGMTTPDAQEVAEATANARAAGDIAVLEAKDRLDQEKVSRNRPVEVKEFNKQVANITKMDDWWLNHINPKIAEVV